MLGVVDSWRIPGLMLDGIGTLFVANLICGTGVRGDGRIGR
jgi:hypothetical protein